MQKTMQVGRVGEKNYSNMMANIQDATQCISTTLHVLHLEYYHRCTSTFGVAQVNVRACTSNCSKSWYATLAPLTTPPEEVTLTIWLQEER